LQADALAQSFIRDDSPDTVYLKPDTIRKKKIVTVYVDSEPEPQHVFDKHSFYSGLRPGIFFPLYAKNTSLRPGYFVSGNFGLEARNMRLETGVDIIPIVNDSISFENVEIKLVTDSDTTLQLVEEFVQVNGTDTVVFRIYDTIIDVHNDTLKYNTNEKSAISYSVLNVPLIVGYNIPYKHLRIFVGGWVVLSMIFPRRSNSFQASEEHINRSTVNRYSMKAVVASALKLDIYKEKVFLEAAGRLMIDLSRYRETVVYRVRNSMFVSLGVEFKL